MAHPSDVHETGGTPYGHLELNLFTNALTTTDHAITRAGNNGY